MGLFGFLGDIAGATVKVALTPVAIVKDVANVVTGEEVDSTENHVESIGDSLENALDEIIPD